MPSGATRRWLWSSSPLPSTRQRLDVLAEAQVELAFGRVDPETGARLGADVRLAAGAGLLIFRERIVLYCEAGAYFADASRA